MLHVAGNTGLDMSANGSPIDAAGALQLYGLLASGGSREIKAEANRKICEFVVSLNCWRAQRGKPSARLNALTLICLGYLAGMGGS